MLNLEQKNKNVFFLNFLCSLVFPLQKAVFKVSKKGALRKQIAKRQSVM